MGGQWQKMIPRWAARETGQWSMVNGERCHPGRQGRLVNGQWSMVKDATLGGRGDWSMVNGQW
jgi:hypothetical protein